MITFRLYTSVRFNRPVDKEKDYFSPGGYEFVFGDKTVQFDFEESCGRVSDTDPTVIEWEQKNPDYDCFEDLKTLTKEDLFHLTDVEEFFIYTGEDDESDLFPVELLSGGFEYLWDDAGDEDICTIAFPDSFIEKVNALFKKEAEEYVR